MLTKLRRMPAEYWVLLLMVVVIASAVLLRVAPQSNDGTASPTPDPAAEMPASADRREDWGWFSEGGEPASELVGLTVGDVEALALNEESFLFSTEYHALPLASGVDDTMVAEAVRFTEREQVYLLTLSADHWYPEHSSVVKEGGSEGCFGCHETTRCANCHISRHADGADAPPPADPVEVAVEAALDSVGDRASQLRDTTRPVSWGSRLITLEAAWHMDEASLREQCAREAVAILEAVDGAVEARSLELVWYHGEVAFFRLIVDHPAEIDAGDEVGLSEIEAVARVFEFDASLY